MSATEFEIIARYFAKNYPQRKDVILGVGDDGAICHIPQGMQLVTSVDTLVEGVHFTNKASPEDIGYKALAVNLSDLAAMGATPAWMTLALTCPNIDEVWLARFSLGLNHLATQMEVSLIGGDVTRGHLTITIQVMGFVPENTALRRDHAQIGDNIYVTGTLGDAGLGLAVTQNEVVLLPEVQDFVESRLHRPTPRVEEGQLLRTIANSSIDISDGLLADLGHILTLSQVGANLQLDDFPLSHSLKEQLPLEIAWNLALSSGDDYELCFTVPPERETQLKNVLSPESYTRIGTIETEMGIRCFHHHDRLFRPKAQGYEHFAAQLD